MIQPKETYICDGCDELVDEIFTDYNYNLCKICNDKYENSTGYCSLSCCVGNGCDESC